MNKFSAIRLSIVCLLLLSACMPFDTRAQETKNVAVNNFSSLSVSAGIELIITQGSAENAKIVASKEVIDEVLIEKDGNELDVHWKSSNGFMNNNKNRKAKVYISYKKLNGISASSGSSLVTENLLKTDRLHLRASSGATVTAKISCTDLELEASSGGSSDISGTAENMTVSCSSGGSVDALQLVSSYAKARASSGGGMEINVSKGLEASTSSGGGIRYKGAAALNNTSSSRNRGVSRIN